MTMELPMTSRAIPVTVPLNESLGGNSIIRRAGRLTLTVIKGFGRMLKARRDVAELASFDDRMLQDIGLSRTDVHAALDGSWRNDPSSVLAQRAAERWALSMRRLRQSPLKAQPASMPARAEKRPVVARYF
jgi:uncharacterized protein YjiS (DUF1127 family)